MSCPGQTRGSAGERVHGGAGQGTPGLQTVTQAGLPDHLKFYNPIYQNFIRLLKKILENKYFRKNVHSTLDATFSTKKYIVLKISIWQPFAQGVRERGEESVHAGGQQ